ncbi:lamin tail domain-containing protein [Streptomyces bathyalis]|uniref:Lamin tail domain-containing protein n=1 Tax=Streptomyces bathyalis TaxID=2710756 RepID=A0A7T1WT14_9ACTN|nr:lamin tail domain-containing protein [Streptomyces bathyalis]QPP08126.1 lamin tail domain-containing protein [Streptomyces bathyalis]
MSASRPLRLAATLLASGALLGAAALPATASDHSHAPRSAVKIGQVQHDTGWNSRYDRGLNSEWVEVRNTGHHTVRLNGWTLTDRDGNRYRFRHVWLRGHSSVIVHTGVGHDNGRHVYQDRRTSVWDSRDAATLRDDDGRWIDTKAWGRYGRR